KSPPSMSGWQTARISNMISKSYCKVLSTLLLGLACLPCLQAQGNQYLTVGEPPKVVGQRSATVQAKIPLSVQAGFQVTTTNPTEEYLIPLKLTWTSTGALHPG